MQRRIVVAGTEGDPQPRQLTDDPAYRDEYPRWSADGSHILFARLDAEDRASLWLMPAEGGAPQQVADDLSPNPGPASFWFGFYGHVGLDRLFAWWPGATPRTPGEGGPGWSVEAEHVITVREAAPWIGSGAVAETRSTVHVWYLPDAGSRMEIVTEGAHRPRHRIIGTDGVTLWVYDPVTNRYTLEPGNPQFTDPRAAFAVTMATAGTRDFDGALAALLQIPDLTVTVVGTEMVAGREARIVHTAPYACAEIVQAQPSGATTRERRCEGSSRYWLDAVTGWLLRAEGDDGRGGGYSWETPAITFDAQIDRDSFRFVPPPGSIQVERLD